MVEQDDEKPKWQIRTVVVTTDGKPLIEEAASFTTLGRRSDRFTIGLISGEGVVWRQAIQWIDSMKGPHFGGNITGHFKNSPVKIWRCHGYLPLSCLFDGWHEPFEAHAVVDALNFARLHFNRPIQKWWPSHQPPRDEGPIISREEMLKVIHGISEETMLSEAAGTRDLGAPTPLVSLPMALCSVRWTTTRAEQAPELFRWIEGLRETSIGQDEGGQAILLYGLRDARPL